MPAAANIVINDGATTPVAHTFTPIGKDDKGVLWFEQSNPTPTNVLGAKRIGVKQTRNTGGNQLTGSSKLTITIALPTLETLGTSDSGIVPPATVSYTNRVRIEYDLPERGTKQERKDLRVFVRNIMNSSEAPDLCNAIDSLIPIY